MIGVEDFYLYDAIPNHFEVRTMFQVVAPDGGLGGLQLIEQLVEPYIKTYAKQGCTLGAIHRYGYAGVPDVAHEAMLSWYLDL